MRVADLRVGDMLVHADGSLWTVLSTKGNYMGMGPGSVQVTWLVTEGDTCRTEVDVYGGTWSLEDEGAFEIVRMGGP